MYIIRSDSGLFFLHIYIFFPVFLPAAAVDNESNIYISTHTHSHLYTYYIILYAALLRRIVGTSYLYAASIYEIFIIVAGTHYPIGKIPPTGFCRSYTYNILYTSYTYIAVTVFVCQLLSLDLISITDIIYYYNACTCVCLNYNIYTYVRVHMMRMMVRVCIQNKTTINAKTACRRYYNI